MPDNRAEPASSIEKFLKSLALFSELHESSITLLAGSSRFKTIEKGEILFFQGDLSDCAYAVQSGKISISINSPDGREMVINEMVAGHIFGELGILTGQHRSTSAVARFQSTLLIISRQALLRILADEPQITRRMLEITANRLQKSSERENSLAFKDAQARLASILLALDKAEQDNGYITISQDELANRTGLIRQTVAKALGRWRRRGWLLTGRGHIVLLDHAALEDIETNLLI
jgi:CRP/FNR family cyclic AMP-dependent transcriptional regulator